MAIPGSASYAALPVDAIIAAPAAAAPLADLLASANGLWLSHRPAALVICPTDRHVATARTFEVAILPSADSLHYVITLDVEAIGVGLVTVTVTTSTDGGATWGAHVVLTQATLAGTAWYVLADVARVIGPTVTHMRYEVSTTGTSCRLSGILVQPEPAAIAAGQYPSGYVPYDDGVLESGVPAPIHVEHVCRGALSALALLHDRVQSCGGYVQPRTHATATERWVPPSGGVVPLTLPLLRIALPGQTSTPTTPVHLEVRARGAVQAGGVTADAICIAQVRSTPGPTPVAWSGDLDDTWQSGTLDVHPEGEGLEAHVDLRVSCPFGDTAHYVELYGLQVFWRPMA